VDGYHMGEQGVDGPRASADAAFRPALRGKQRENIRAPGLPRRLGVRLPARLIVLSAAGLCAACYPYARALRTGEPVPSRPRDCELTYARVAPADAQAQWRQVGEVCLSAPPLQGGQTRVVDVYQPGDMHDVLTEWACSLGGEIVTPVGLCSNGRSNAVAFGVYVPR
jgi:hypothetical protein